MPEYVTYQCQECTYTASLNNRGVRCRYPCKECDEITTFERQGTPQYR